MESKALLIDPSVNIKMFVDNPAKIELIDNLEVTPAIEKRVLFPFLRNLWHSLFSRQAQSFVGLSPASFEEYASLSGLLGVRLFHLLDSNKDGFLSQDEFVNNFKRVFTNDFEANAKLIFDLFDSDANGIITKDDISTLMSHIPVTKILEEHAKNVRKEGKFTKTGGGLELFLDRVQSIEELSLLVDTLLKDKDRIDFKTFKEITETSSCTIYLCIFLFFRTNCPVFSGFADYYTLNSKEQKLFSTPVSAGRKLLPSPELKPETKLGPLNKLQKNSPMLQARAPNTHPNSLLASIAGKVATPSTPKAVQSMKDKSEERKSLFAGNKVPLPTSPKSPCMSSETEVVRMSVQSKILPPQPSAEEETKTLVLPSGEIFKQEPPSPITISPSVKKVVLFCACGNECEENPDKTYKSRCKKCSDAIKTPSFSGYLYERDPKNAQNLLRGYYMLNGKTLYKYKEKGQTEPILIHALTGALLKNELQEQVSKDLTLYPFKIYLGSTFIKLYALQRGEKHSWVDCLKACLDYTSFLDYYTLKSLLGKGKFGEVSLAIHKATSQRVAVKVLKKCKMTGDDYDLVCHEIEILKLCQHSNIVRLLDNFENADTVYIVLEYLPGGDLYNYWKKHHYSLSEDRVITIIHSLATALYYLHKYGVIHRDLKLENVLMADETEDSDVKIADFGLSKMVMPGEKCTEPYGTFGYAAPEIFAGTPYDKSVDIWTLGVIAYTLIQGESPFEAETGEKVAKRTLHEQVNFNTPKWAKISDVGKISIKRMLSKDPQMRPSLKELLDAAWISNKCKVKRGERTVTSPSEQFRIYTQNDPDSLHMLDDYDKRKSAIEEEKKTSPI